MSLYFSLRYSSVEKFNVSYFSFIILHLRKGFLQSLGKEVFVLKKEVWKENSNCGSKCLYEPCMNDVVAPYLVLRHEE